LKQIPRIILNIHTPSLARKNLGSLLILLSLFIAITLGGMAFYRHSRAVLEDRLKNELQETATIAALSIPATDIQKIQKKEDALLPVYASVVRQLKRIEQTSPLISSVYIMRKTDTQTALAFVADADALDTRGQLDLNVNGVIDKNEEVPSPGELYDIRDIPALREAFNRPMVDATVTQDQWGKTISGYAPIHDAGGNTVGVLGLDMNASDFLDLSQRIVSPIALLTILCGLFLIGTSVLLWTWKQRVQSFEEIEHERFAMIDLMVHQLGAPLATFRWWLELLSDQKGTPEEREAFEHMQEGVERMGGILATLMDANRLMNEGGGQNKTASLKDILEKIESNTASMLRRKKQTLSVMLHPLVAEKVIDLQTMETILSELIENASSFSPEGTTISIRVLDDQTGIRFDVEDHGCGIPPEDLARVGEKFVRASNASRYKPVGNGLGLFITKRLVERLGGVLRLTSSLKTGTLVTFTLPRP
jgi:signal transduction histidine kinase